MKKRKLLITLAVICFVAIATVIAIFIYKKYNCPLDIDANKITKIYITNGSNGDVAEVPDSNIPKLTKLINEIRVQNGEKMDSTGWEYSISLSDGDTETNIELISDSCIVVDGMKYDISKDVGEPIYNMCKGEFK